MLYTVYCGYINFSIVIIFIIVGILLVRISILFCFFFSNFDIIVVSLKVFNVGFFGDMEILLRV